MGGGCKERRERMRRAFDDEATRDKWINRAIWGVWAFVIGLVLFLAWMA